MAAIDDLKSAIAALETQATDLETRLLSYDPGQFDVEIAGQTEHVNMIAVGVSEIAPVEMTAGALELKAVT